MRIRISVITIALITAFAFIVNIPVSIQAAGCDDILKHGVWETRSLDYSEHSVESFYHYLRKQIASGRVSARETSGNFELIIEGFPIAGAFFNSKKEVNKFISDVMVESKHTVMRKIRLMELERKASVVIVRAWSDCMRQVDRAGVILTAEVTSSPRKYIITTSFKDIPSPNPRTAKVEEFKADSMIECESVLTKGKVLSAAPKKIICTINGEQTGLIKLSTENYGDKVVELKPPPSKYVAWVSLWGKPRMGVELYCNGVHFLSEMSNNSKGKVNPSTYIPMEAGPNEIEVYGRFPGNNPMGLAVKIKKITYEGKESQVDSYKLEKTDFGGLGRSWDPEVYLKIIRITVPE